MPRTVLPRLTREPQRRHPRSLRRSFGPLPLARAVHRGWISLTVAMLTLGVIPVSLTAAAAAPTTPGASPHATHETAARVALGEPDTAPIESSVDTIATTDSVAGTAAPQLTVAPGSPVFEISVDTYEFTVLVRNPSDDILPRSALRLRLDRTPLADTEALASSWLTDHATDLAIVATPEVPAGEERVIPIRITRGSPTPFDSLEAGVYLVGAEYVLPKDVAASLSRLSVHAVTPVVWQSPEQFGEVAVTSIIPLMLPASVRTMPTRPQLSDVIPGLSRLLSIAEAQHATLAVDPRLVAGIRAYGTAAPTEAREFLATLEATELPVFLLQFADADPTLQAALGFDELLKPSGFGFVTRFGSFTPEIPLTPSIGALQDLPNASARIWPAAGQVTADTIKISAVDRIASFVLDSGSVERATGTRVSLGEATALVADTDLTAFSHSAIAGETPTERDSATARIVASLALHVGDESPSVVLALDRGAIADASEAADSTAAEQLLVLLDSLPWVTPVGEQLQPEGTAALKEGSTGEDRLQFLRDSLERSDEINELAALLEQPRFLTEYQRQRVLELMGTRYATDYADFAAVEKRSQERDAALLLGVEVITNDRMQLLGTVSRVPLLVRNHLPFDAEVGISVTPISAAIHVPDTHFGPVAVPAEGSETVLIPVETRVSSGNSGLLVAVTQVDETHAFSRAIQSLILSSSFETIALISLGLVAASLLGLGIWRSVRRSRRTAAVSPVDQADPAVPLNSPSSE